MRSSECVVPTATSSVQPTGGRSSSSKCCLSSGLSTGCLQTVENVSEQSLAYEPREFQLGRAGIAGATVAVRGLSMRARFFFSRRSRSRINRRAAELSRNRAASPPKARSHHSIDEFVRGGCNPRIYGADQFPETLPIPLRQHTGARLAVAQH